jgi:Dyp-type peroxidase family
MTWSPPSPAPEAPTTFPEPRADPTGDSLRTSGSIQGNIVAGFSKDFQSLLFLQVQDRAGGLDWLAELRPRVATTAQVATFNKQFSEMLRTSGSDPQHLAGVWVNVSFTAEGLELMAPRLRASLQVEGIDDGVQLFTSGARAQAEQLGDIGRSSPDHWVFGRDGQHIHLVVTVAADRSEDLAVEVHRQRELAARHNLLMVFEQTGATLPGPHKGQEHFGFKDGISQPGVRGYDLESQDHPGEVEGKPGTNLIAAGEFLLGYPRHNGGKRNIPEWLFDGSFLVVRRLAQDVPAWWAQVEHAYLQLPQAVREELSADAFAARFVGRWRSGTPVDKAPRTDLRGGRRRSEDNDFDFEADPSGDRCPRFAHIRKVYPRSTSPVGVEGSNLHRILRRGIPFGPAFDPTAGRGHGIDSERGLVFACYQSSLSDQFQFLQQSCVNNTNFPDSDDGTDPVIGVDGPVTVHLGGDTTPVPSLQRCVQTQGSVYALTPSMETLQTIIDAE